MILSIIIPVYNVEKYIRGTLDSIYSQNYDESQFEVIVVNDGTPDNSMVIVGEYTIHANLTVINKENGGLSSARNAGLAIAKGDYIWFVDSDDKVTPSSLSTIIDEVGGRQCDVYGFGVIKIKELDCTETVEQPALDSSLYNKVSNSLFLSFKIHSGMIQRYVFSKRFLEEQSLKFKEGIWYEDNEIMVRLIATNCGMTFTNKSIYRYLIRESGSIMSTFNMRSINDTLSIIKIWSKQMCESTNKQVLVHYSYHIAEQLIWILTLNSNKQEYINYVKKNRNTLKKELMRFYIYGILQKPIGHTLRVLKTLIFS